MSQQAELVCIGDLMLESIVRTPVLPSPRRTLVLDGQPLQVGGTAFNLCWYLAQWGWNPKLVSVYGQRQEPMIRATLAAASISDSGLIRVEGESDLLLVFLRQDEYSAVYLRSRLPADMQTAIRDRYGRPARLVITGSRHPAVRKLSVQLAADFRGSMLAFSPSYAIYEYASEDLQSLLVNAHFVALNDSELEFACRLCGYRSPQALTAAMRGCLIVTLAQRGVEVHDRGEVLRLGSFSHSDRDVIGAGDAFFAAFLHALSQDDSLLRATRYASIAAAALVDSAEVRGRIPETFVQQQMILHFGNQAAAASPAGD